MQKQVIYKFSESQEQIKLINWFRINYPELIIFHIPNGGNRNLIEASKLKREGVLSGVPDLQIILNNGKTIFIEMKNYKGKLSLKQKELILKFENLGHIVIVAYSFEEAKKELEKYI